MTQAYSRCVHTGATWSLLMSLLRLHKLLFYTSRPTEYAHMLPVTSHSFSLPIQVMSPSREEISSHDGRRRQR